MAELSDVPSQLLAELSLPDRQSSPPLLIGVFGLPCAGKTALAKQIAGRIPAALLSTDAVRLRFNLSDGLQAQGVIYDAAEQLLRNQISVIFDGIHLQRKNRDELRDFARRNHAKQSLIYVTASRNVIHARLKQRLENPEQTRESAKFVITQEHFERLASYLEEPVGEADVLVIDTSEGVDHERLDQLCSLLQEKIDHDGTDTTV